jgi:hypothetical protein
MPDAYVQVAPDSTGKLVRTRERTVGANTVQEPYAIVLPSERVVSSRAWYSSLRIPNQAATSTPMFTVYNTGTNPVAIRRLAMEVDAVAAHAVASPYVRLYRLAGTAPTGGTAVTAIQQDTGDAAIAAGVVVRGAYSADGTYSAITISAGITGPAWVQTLPRFHTLAGFSQIPVLNLMPDDAALMTEDPLILRTNQGLLCRFEAAAAPVASVWSLMFKTVIGEFTVP